MVAQIKTLKLKLDLQRQLVNGGGRQNFKWSWTGRAVLDRPQSLFYFVPQAVNLTAKLDWLGGLRKSKIIRDRCTSKLTREYLLIQNLQNLIWSTSEWQYSQHVEHQRQNTNTTNTEILQYKTEI